MSGVVKFIETESALCESEAEIHPKGLNMASTIPPRNKVNKKYTWNAESVFKSDKEWEMEVKNILADHPGRKEI